MQLTHNFTVPAEIDQAWKVLLDIERIAPCMPGAAIETVDGDDFTGTVKVRLGPIGLTYRGKASFVEKDAVGHRAVIDAQGKDARGNGTAKAIITATLTSQGSETAVNVVTDLNITGKPAQFGRGVMVDVGNKLIGQFADCLAGKLTGSEAGSQDAAEVGTGVGAGGVGAGAGAGEVGAGAGEVGAEVGAGEVGAGEVGAGGAGADRVGIAEVGVPGVGAAVGVAGIGAGGIGAGGIGAGGIGAGGVGAAGLDPASQLDAADPDIVERLASADLESAEQLGTADLDTPDLDTAELGASGPDLARSAGEVDSGVGSPAPDRPAAGGPGLAEPGVVEAGLAELRTAPAVAPDSAVAGPGLAQPAAALTDTAADPTVDETVVALPGAASDEQAVEPAAAAEAAPPAQRLNDIDVASTGRPAQPAPGPTLASPPAHRPAVADVEPIDLLGSAGPAIAKRLAPVAAGGTLLVLLLLLRRRRRSASRTAERQAATEYWAAVQRWAAAERQLAAQRRDSIKQRQLDGRVLRLAGVLGQLSEPASTRSAVLGWRPGRPGRPAAGRGRTSR
jgi:carbon monoxide dehydrogenase subunit G